MKTVPDTLHLLLAENSLLNSVIPDIQQDYWRTKRHDNHNSDVTTS